jgi:hypothetical protein
MVVGWNRMKTRPVFFISCIFILITTACSTVESTDELVEQPQTSVVDIESVEQTEVSIPARTDTIAPSTTPNPVITPLPSVTYTLIPETHTSTPQNPEYPETLTAFPTPDFPSSTIVDSIFFLPQDTSDCQPPCWQNLRVGESTKADIQSVFDNVFGFDGTRNFFEDATQLAPVWLSEVPGMQTDGYDWITPDGDMFIIATVIDSNTNILQGIEFYYLATGH